MSQRIEQLGSVLRHAVQDVLARGLNDPRVRGLISVTRLEITPDLAEARVYVSVLPAEHAALSLAGLAHAVAHVQREVNKKVVMKRVPRISFVLDDTLKKQAEVYAAIQKSSGQAAEQ